MPKKKAKPKAKRRIRGGKPSAVLSTHVEGAPEKNGSDERLLLKRSIAYRNRLNGMDNISNAKAIQVELGLEEPPPVTTISMWISETYREARGELTEMCKHEVMEGVEKLKNMINRFYPMAMGRLHIERVVTGPEGLPVMVVDAEAFQEQIKAGALVTKQLETIQTLLNGETRKKDPEGDLPGGLKSFQLTVISEIRHTMYNPQKEAGHTLSLDSPSALDVEVEKL